MKITKNIISEVPLRDVKRGETFLDNGITQDFPPDIMVLPVDAEIIVSYSKNRREL